jgi:hypothetical protein
MKLSHDESFYLEKLKDDNEYYGGVGKEFLSNSDIGTLLRNPREFRVPRPDNPNFVKGRYFHQSLLEPEKANVFPYVDVASRNSLKYKEAIKDAGVEVMMLQKEKAELDALIDRMRGHFHFYEQMYLNGNQFEVPGVKEFGGVWWKGKADIISDSHIIDLKTTSNLDDFRYSARKYNYDSQAYIYQSIFGKPLIFFAVDKLSGELGIFECSEEFIMAGKAKVERALEVYERFFGDNASDSVDNYYIHETL